MDQAELNAIKAPFHAIGVREISVHHDGPSAVERIHSIYQHGKAAMRQAFALFARGQNRAGQGGIDAFYPYIGTLIDPAHLNVDARLAFGALLDPGPYGTTLTRPEFFRDYYIEQIDMLIHHHGLPVVVGISDQPMPLPFVIEESTADIGAERTAELMASFPLPDLALIDDSIANGTFERHPARPRPLALFKAQRVDYSFVRLHHYTATAPEHFQRFVLLTNYQRYIDHFIAFARHEIAEGTAYEAFVEPGNAFRPNPRLTDQPATGEALAHLPQMPAYHLKRADGDGITMVNIGVGPANARNITDHLAVLRPHCFLILGHCAGLRRSQQLGDYVLAHGYVREDNVLDDDLPPFVPVPPIAEVQVALSSAVAKITGLEGRDLKARMRTGTVATTDNRNWELRYHELFQRLNQSRAIAVDMESATIAANGFRYRVPYGTLLCVSDKPLHGELKLRGMANTFYRERINQHLQIGLEAIEILRAEGTDKLHSRKLRSFDEPAFR